MLILPVLCAITLVFMKIDLFYLIHGLSSFQGFNVASTLLKPTVICVLKKIFQKILGEIFPNLKYVTFQTTFSKRYFKIFGNLNFLFLGISKSWCFQIFSKIFSKMVVQKNWPKVSLFQNVFRYLFDLLYCFIQTRNVAFYLISVNIYLSLLYTRKQWSVVDASSPC